MSDGGFGHDPSSGGEIPGSGVDPYHDYRGGMPAPADGPPPGALAGFWIRFAGMFLDGLLLGVLTTAITFGSTTGGTNIVRGVLAGIYFVFFHSTKAGQTPGMAVCGIRVVDATTGRRVEPAAAAIRWLMSYVSAIPLLLGYFWMLWDDRNQTWHDKVAGTVVVKAAVVPAPTSSLLER